MDFFIISILSILLHAFGVFLGVIVALFVHSAVKYFIFRLKD